MKQSEQARREALLDQQEKEQQLVKGARQEGHWPAGQHAPLKDQGFDRSHQGAPRADDRSDYKGQSAYGSLEAGPNSTLSSKDQNDVAGDQGGGLSRYGNNLGSRFAIDQEAGTSQRTANAPLSQKGFAPGAAPASTDVGQYAGEYDDAAGKPQAAARAAEPNSRAARDAKPLYGSSAELRGDEQLKEEIHQRLIEHPDLDIHDLSVALRDGHATLEGSVPDAHMKQVIVELVDNVTGVLKIDDCITVQHVNPANHTTAQAYAVGGQVTDDLQHSGPATFGAASAKASAIKQQEAEKKAEKKQQASDDSAEQDGKS